MSDLEKKFLICSSGYILGPFSKQEVIDLIKIGKISVCDEVAEPFTIWRYLQNHKDFKKTVYSVNIQTRLTNFLTQVSSKITHTKKTVSMKTDTQTLKDEKNFSDQGIKTFTLPDIEKQSAPSASFKILDQAQTLLPFDKIRLPSGY